MSSTDERRAHRRLPVELWVDQELGDVTYFQRSGNLSVGGMYLLGTPPESVGTRVNLRFTLPGEQAPVTVAAEVVGGDVDPDHMGMRLRFVDTGAELVERIDAALARHGQAD